MNHKMNHHGADEITGWFAGISAYALFHWIKFPILQIHQYPALSFLLVKFISLFFAALSAVAAYLAVHYTKKWLNHEK